MKRRKNEEKMSSREIIAIAAPIVVIAGGIGAVSWIVLKLWHRYHKATDTVLDKILEKYSLYTEPGPGRVPFCYPAYVGALFTVQETVVQAWMEKHDARRLLGDLLSFNLKRGLLTGLAPYVLLLTLSNYLGQRWKLR
ncbi:MAG: hypothetical protein V1809_13220 [Planctomycetota bacterium]